MYSIAIQLLGACGFLRITTTTNSNDHTDRNHNNKLIMTILLLVKMLITMILIVMAMVSDPPDHLAVSVNWVSFFVGVLMINESPTYNLKSRLDL